MSNQAACVVDTCPSHFLSRNTQVSHFPLLADVDTYYRHHPHHHLQHTHDMPHYPTNHDPVTAAPKSRNKTSNTDNNGGGGSGGEGGDGISYFSQGNSRSAAAYNKAFRHPAPVTNLASNGNRKANGNVQANRALQANGTVHANDTMAQTVIPGWGSAAANSRLVAKPTHKRERGIGQPLRAHPTNITASSRPFSSSGVENSTNRIVEGSSCNNSMGIAAGGRVSNSSVNALGGRATGNGAQRHAAADDIAGERSMFNI